MLRALRSLRILFSLPAILFVLGTSCMGKKHHELPGDSFSALLTAAEAGDANTVRKILREVQEGKRPLPLSEILSTLNRAAEKGAGEVVEAILEEGEEYLKVADLKKAGDYAQLNRHSEIEKLIQKYIKKKKRPIKRKGRISKLTEAGKLIKEILEGNIVNIEEDVESNRAKIQEVVKMLLSIVSDKQEDTNEELKERQEARRKDGLTERTQEEEKCISGARKLNIMSASLAGMKDRDGRVKELEGAVSKSIKEIREIVIKIGGQLQEIVKELKKIEENSKSRKPPLRSRETPEVTEILELTFVE